MMDEEVVLIDIFTPLREDFCDPCLDLTIELLSSPALQPVSALLSPWRLAMPAPSRLPWQYPFS